jgi:hypothetical protein
MQIYQKNAGFVFVTPPLSLVGGVFTGVSIEQEVAYVEVPMVHPVFV